MRMGGGDPVPSESAHGMYAESVDYHHMVGSYKG